MAVAAVALNIDEALDVHLDVLAEVALDVTLVLNHLADAVYLFFAQVLDFLEAVNIRLLQDLQRAGVADAEDVSERDPGLLLRGRSTPAIRAMLNPLVLLVIVPPAMRRFARVTAEILRGSSQALTRLTSPWTGVRDQGSGFS